jgi:hypothetical protein
MRHYEDDPADKQAEDVAAVLRGLVQCPRCGGAGGHINFAFPGASAEITVCGLCCGGRWADPRKELPYD